jgi:hypothetical protein
MEQQPSLFDPPGKPAEPRPVNVPFIRSNLIALLRKVRLAEIMPWYKADADYWEREFPRLAQHLPPEEREAMVASFQHEIARLKAIAADRAV